MSAFYINGNRNIQPQIPQDYLTEQAQVRLPLDQTIDQPRPEHVPLSLTGGALLSWAAEGGTCGKQRQGLLDYVGCSTHVVTQCFGPLHPHAL